MLILQILLGIVTLALPLAVGSLWKEKSIGLSWALGQFTLWAGFQVLAVPMINLLASFHMLFWAYIGLAAVLAMLGIRARRQVPFERPQIRPLIWIAALIVLYQAGKYVFGIHLDQDDARWLAEANDALSRDTMLLSNPATGAYLGLYKGEMIKDVFSPWSMYIATLARMTFLRPVVIAHTTYPPVLLAMSYVMYARIGKKLFKGTLEQGIFLIAVGIINLTFSGYLYTQSVFTLARIWQGKAVVAAVLIPALLLMTLRIEEENSRKSWLALVMTGCAGCLLSGIGIVVSALMIGIYGGYAILCRRFRLLPWYLLALLSPAACGLSWLWIRGV